MTPEKHLAAILQAWNETDGYTITPEMNAALEAAEKDFDGVEDVGYDGAFEGMNLNAYAIRREIMPIDKHFDEDYKGRIYEV